LKSAIRCLASSMSGKGTAPVSFSIVQEHRQILRALVKDAIASVRKPDPQFAQLALDLRGDRECRRRLLWRSAVQVLFSEVVDLRRTPGRQRLDELAGRFAAE
jgi:hypothetical protein